MTETGGRACWCGFSDLKGFSPNYLRCPECGSLVYQGTGPQAGVTDDSVDFYGRGYWFEHQERCFGFPNIVERAVLDLSERCVYWLQHLLEYKLPPSRVLELGCAHGGSVALMRWAGFDAIGLELSPWVVEFARKSFDVPVLQGPLESHNIKQQSLDAICMFDVLEHFEDPVSTLAHCRNLLRPEGIFLIQTPELPENLDYDQMSRGGDARLEQLKEQEHLFLFSRHGVRRLFAKLGYGTIHFLEPLFGYDMFFVASNGTLKVNTAQAISQALCRKPSGRLVQEMLTLYEDKNSLRAELEKYRANLGMRTIPYILKRSAKNFLGRCFHVVRGAHTLLRKR
ncbi:MAG: class I SAM-dependent methyltransferase [Desulfomonilaceae bacterium]